MRNRTLTQSWRLFRRLNRVHDDAMQVVRSTASFSQAERAMRRVNCAEFMLAKLNQYLNKHGA